MHRVFKKDQVLTIPNLLSLVRLALIPLIIWLYCVKQNFTVATVMILVSGLTDIVDGFIARRFHMVSDFGKILDPVADKLTQGAVIICLTVRYKLMYALIGLFVVKEAIMAAMGYLVIRKKNAVNSAKWYGKVNTLVLYVVMMVLILIPGIPDGLANGLILVCGVMMLLSLFLYIRFYRGLLAKGDGKERKEKDDANSDSELQHRRRA